MAKRRENAKLIQKYKIVNNLVPNTLQSIIHGNKNSEIPTYNTRQSSDLPRFRTRTDLFSKSFFPSTVRLWNALPLEIRNSPSLAQFKSKLQNIPSRPVIFPQLYNFGSRFASILHTRFRLGSSQLNSCLFKLGIKPTATCNCGSANEDTWHYFFACPKYAIVRSKLHTAIAKFAPFTMHTIFYGSSECTLHENMQIFLAVQDYIITTSRFSNTGLG